MSLKLQNAESQIPSNPLITEFVNISFLCCPTSLSEIVTARTRLARFNLFHALKRNSLTGF